LGIIVISGNDNSLGKQTGKILVNKPGKAGLPFVEQQVVGFDFLTQYSNVFFAVAAIFRVIPVAVQVGQGDCNFLFGKGQPRIMFHVIQIQFVHFTGE